MPLWVILALGAAFSLATSDALTKRAVQDQDEYLVAWTRLLFTLPLLGFIWFFIEIPEIDRTFIYAFCLSLPLEIITVFLYIKALKSSPLGLTLPFLSLTPLFLIISARIIAGEKVSNLAASGIILIVAGGYVLNISAARLGFLEPFRAIGKEKGSLLMIAVAFIYSITSSLGKLAVEHSSALFFGITYFTMLVILTAPVSLWLGRKSIKRFFLEGNYKRLFLPGLFYGLMIIFHMMSLDLTKVSYMISVKRLSLLIGVIYGHIFFNERNFRERLTGTVLMLAGFVILVNSGE
ncbi:MAG: DMT family transporter [Thermodesulfovibrionales bacterium]|nr:DMT family transporter [Thermodesulfovibrionales bacterium]